MVDVATSSISGKDQMRQDATGNMSLLWEATCPGCRLVFGRDEDGFYEEDPTDGSSGSDGQLEKE